MFNGNRLVCRLHFNSIEIEIEIDDFSKLILLVLCLQFDVDEPLVRQVVRAVLAQFGRFIVELDRVDVHGDLEMILLLTDEHVVYGAEIETLIRIDLKFGFRSRGLCKNKGEKETKSHRLATEIID